MSMPRLTESPDLIRLPGGTEDHAHPSAWSYLILDGKTVASSRRTHPYIFNALKAVADPESANDMVRGTLRREGPQGVYDDYGVRFFPQEPDSIGLVWFKSNYTGEMGEMRRITKSGRVWKSVETVKGKPKVAALSFWCQASEVNPQDVDLLVAAFKLQGEIYVEYIDSKCPILYNPTKAPETKELRSQKHPEFDPKRIIDILVKAHTSPFDLTQEEKDIVDEFRGVARPGPKQLGGFASPAERNFRRTIGDSVELTIADLIGESLGSYSPPGDATLLFFDFYCLYTIAYKYGDLYQHYHPSRNDHPIVHFRVAEAVNEAFFRVKERVKKLMLSQIPLACLEEALRLNNTEQFDLEALYLELHSQGILGRPDPVTPGAPPGGTLQQYISQYVERKTPGLGGKVNGFITAVLRMALKHAHVEGGSVIFMSEFVPDQEVGLLVRTMGGRIDLGLLETIFTLKWLPDHGGQKWFEICEVLRKLQETKTMKTEVFLIDRIYDLEHNTGSILEKAPALWVSKDSLDTRFLIRNVREFMGHVSDQCRKIAVAVSRTMDT